MRGLPRHQEHAGQRDAGAGPVQHRRPPQRRGGCRAERHREPGRLDHRFPGHQPRAPDAAHAAPGPGLAGARGVPPEPAVGGIVAVAAPEQLAERVAGRLEELWEEKPGFGSFLSTVDHKRIGRNYCYTAFLLFLAGGVEALFVRTQLARPDLHLVSPERFNELFSMHGITMIFFFVTPMLFGFGNYFLPLMIGARDMAFPRLNRFGYWNFVLAALFMYSSWLVGRAPNDGWFNYVPISNFQYTPGLNIDYYTLGLAFLGLSTTVATMTIAIVAFGVWVHHMFATGLPNETMAFFSVASLLITIPSGIQIFAWTATLLGGRPVWKTPMLFVTAFLFLFVIGGVTGVMFAAVPFDQQITDSYFIVAHFHYVLFGGAVFPILAAVYYWTPKMSGRLLHEGWGKLSFWLIFLGFNLTFFPMHIAGLLGMPRRVYTYHGGLGWDVWNLLSTIGGYVLAAGLLVVVLNALWSLRSGALAGPDPWGAHDLEWATSSPPPHYNFLEIPTVRSNSPLWDQPELREMGRRIHDLKWTLTEGHETVGTTVVDAVPESVLPMPEGTHAPVITAIGIAVVFVGFLTLLVPVVAAGVVV